MNAAASHFIADSETSTLFNPAFCAVLVNKACAEFESKTESSMPITFAFLILPSALHKPTREALPGTTGATMWGWLRENPILLMDFVDRVRAFRPITAEAIVYGLRSTALKSSPGLIGAGDLKRRPSTLHPTEDWSACIKASEFLGRWFAGANKDVATTLAHWGVKP